MAPSLRRPGTVERLPVRSIARVPIDVVTGIPFEIEQLGIGRVHQCFLGTVSGLHDEVDAPLSAHDATNAAMRQVLVKDDDVSGAGRKRHSVGRPYGRLEAVRTRDDAQRTGGRIEGLEVCDEAEARDRRVTVSVEAAGSEVPRALGGRPGSTCRPRSFDAVTANASSNARLTGVRSHIITTTRNSTPPLPCFTSPSSRSPRSNASSTSAESSDGSNALRSTT